MILAEEKLLLFIFSKKEVESEKKDKMTNCHKSISNQISIKRAHRLSNLFP